MEPLKERITLRSILLYDNFWERYKSAHNMRDIEVKEVEKMLLCQDPSKGFLTFGCLKCGTTKTIHFSCNSRICTRCGKIYADKWAESVANSLFDVTHRHVVMTIAEELWPYVKEHRRLQKVMMDCAITVFKDVFKFRQRRKVIPAFVVALHPFGKDLGFRPHIHILVAEGGFCDDKWVSIPFFSYEALRKCWQYQILTRFKAELKESNPEIGHLVDRLFKEKKEGFYVRAKDRIMKRRQIARYIGRYIRHPAIAESRITSFDGKTVIFYYERCESEDKRVKTRYYKSMSSDVFITSVLQHIPDRQFKMVRYYGAYSRVKKSHFRHFLRQSMFQATIPLSAEETGILCDNCGCKMVLIEYNSPGPPKIDKNEILLGDKLPHWFSA